MTEEQAGWQQWALKNLAKIQNNGTFEAGPIDAEPISAGIHLQPPFDVVETLPPAAAEKLRLLRQRAADAHLLIPPGEDVRQASMARIEAQNELKRRTDHPQDGGFGLKPGDPRVVAAEKHRDKLTAEFERLRGLQTVRTAQWQAASAALSNTENWLRHGKPSGVQLLDNDGPEPKLAKGEANLLDAVENRRRRARELRADLHRIASAPFPSAYCKQRLRQIVEQAAAHGAPDVSGLVELDQEDVRWPQKRVRSEVLGTQGALAFHEAVDVVGLLAFLLKPTLISALDALVDAEQDDPAALTHEQRQKAEAEAQNDLLATERDICALIWRGQADGLPLEFPADISPIALLGLRLVTPPRADGLPGTTPGLSWDLLR
jgi:hypothetical protein